MNLMHFPPEVLGHMLTPPASSFLCLQLWNTGDRLLQRYLSHAMVSLDLRPKFLIPSVVSKLPGLRHFAIAAYGRSDLNYPHNIKMLEMLPRTLESLTLDFFSADHFLTNYSLPSGDTFEIPIYTHYTRGQSPFIYLNGLFPHLTSFNVNSFDEGEPFIDPRDLLPVLPSSLTELSINKVFFTSSFASMLPRSLIKLNCSLDWRLSHSASELFEEAWFDAPPHLEYIGGLSLSDTEPETLWFPKTITEIGWCLFELSSPQDLYAPTKNLVISNSADFQTDPTLVWTAKLPSTLTRLDFLRLTSLPLTHLHCLPPSLTHLGATISWTTQDLEDSKLRLSTLWPPALTHLEVITRSFDIFMSVLPRTLETLHMREKHSLDQAGWDWDRRFQHTLITHEASFDHWPSNITRMTVDAPTNFGHWPTLPCSLIEFEWHKRSSSDAYTLCFGLDETEPNTFDEWSSTIPQVLPKDLPRNDAV